MEEAMTDEEKIKAEAVSLRFLKEESTAKLPI